MPILYILAGPNGAGKTTWYNTAVEQGFIDPSLSFINIDLITLTELGGYSGENFIKAELIARERISAHILSRESFMIESNLSKTSEYEWIGGLVKNGYEPVLYFLGTDDIDINKNRVKKRVREGGHDVPDVIIEHRYRMGLSYLKSKILIFKEAYIIDNSEEESKVLVILKSGKIVKKESVCPAWIEDLLWIATRIQDRI